MFRNIRRILFAVIVLTVMIHASSAQINFDSKTFLDWMDSGNGTQLYGNESIHEVVSKVILRVEEWVEDKLRHPVQMKDILQFSTGEQNKKSEILSSPARVPLQLEESREADMEKYIDELLSRHFDSWSNMNWGDSWTPDSSNPYPFFSFLPEYVGTVVPGGEPLTFSSPCFATTTVQAYAPRTDNSLVVVDFDITVGNSTSWTCSDYYAFGTMTGVMPLWFMISGKHSYTWRGPADITDSEMWDFVNNGIRVTRFLHNPLTTLVDVYESVQLFLEPLTNAQITQAVIDRNMYFLKTYAQIPPEAQKRSTNYVEIDESYIQSGDIFGIVRYDGVDPLLAWAMGSTTGHITLAIRDENNELFIAESTTKDAFWPTNGVQITPFQQWMEQAKNAGFGVVHAPLAPEYASKFNRTKALEFFKTVEGLDYGFHSLLWTYIDTENDNYPCLPPDFETCIVWDHLHVFFGWLDRIVPSIGDQLFNGAMNIRLNSTNLKAADIFRRTAELGIASDHLPVIVEQDSWKYNTTRNGTQAFGESLVCCTFACRMWKEGGIFDEIGSAVNCQEFTNWDVYSLKIFDPDKLDANRPKQCVDADPNNSVCQLMGDYTLNLNNFNSKPMYAHMAEKCASKPPHYVKDPHC